MKKKKLLIPLSAVLLSASMLTAVPVLADYVDADGFTWIDDSFLWVDDVSEEDSSSVAKALDGSDESANKDDESNEAVEVDNRFKENKNDSVVIDDVNVIILPELKRDGYKHVYWSNTPDDTGDRYMIGEKYEVGTDADIYAIWSENKFEFKLDTVEFDVEGKKYNTPQTITVKGTEEGEFKNSVYIGSVKEFDVSAKANALSAVYGDAKSDEECNIEISDVQGGTLDKNIVKPTDKTVIVTYKVTVERTDSETNKKEEVASSTVKVKYDIDVEAEATAENKEAAKDDAVSDNNVQKDAANTADTDEKAEEAKDEKSAKKEASYSFMPSFEGAEGEMAPIAVKEMTELSAIAPEIEGYTYDHAEINGKRVVMIDKNEYYDDDWQTIDKDTEITFVYKKSK